MSHLKKLRKALGGKRIDESPRKLSASKTATHLLEQDSDVGVGSLEKEDKMSKLLIESMPVQMQIVESKGDKMIARGEFGRVGVATQNGRIYPETIMASQIDRLDDDITNRRVLGELDHPTDGKTSLKRVSHVITGLRIKDGIIVGEAEILNTPEGQTLKALIEAKVQLGVSSRGYGSTKPSTDPKVEGDVVQDDFVLKTWDFVADPAVKTALPQIYQEDVEADEVSPGEMFLAEFPEIAQQIQEDAVAKAKAELADAGEPTPSEDVMEQYEKRFAHALTEAREEIAKDLREEFENDPEMGGAKATLEAILDMAAQFRATPDEKAAADALKAKDLEVAEAAEMAAELAHKAVQAEALLAAERKIGGHPMVESIRNVLDKSEYDNVDEALEIVESILSEMPDAGEIVTKDQVELHEENVRLEEKANLLEEKVAALKGKLKKAVDVGTTVDSRLQDAESRVLEAEEALEKAEETAAKAVAKFELLEYKYEKVATLSNGRKMLSLLEDATSKKQVDALVSGRGAGGVSMSELTEMRKKLRKGKQDRPDKQELHEEDTPSPSPGTDDLGNDIGDMRRLAGIGNLD